MSEATASDRITSAIQRRFCAEVAVPDTLVGAEALATMNERSVCRSYCDRPLDEALVRLLCATALSSPSKSDLQQATIIRVRAPQKLSSIRALLRSSPWIATAPEFLVVCGDHSRLQQSFVRRGSEFPNNHLDSFFNAAVDAGIVLAGLVQAASFAGLGCCPISEIRDHIDAVSSLLELPKWVFPVAGLTLGYPLSFEPMSPRLGLEATVHIDSYDAVRTDTELDAYDARRARDRPYRLQREPERFPNTACYGWSEDKYRQYSNPQRMDFGAFIRRQGFCVD